MLSLTPLTSPKQFASQFMALPLFSDDRETMQCVYQRLTATERRTLLEGLDDIGKLSTFLDLTFHYAGLKYPKTGTWPAFPRREIVENIRVNLPPVIQLRWHVSGLRLVYHDADGTGSDAGWASFAEYEDRYGIDVVAHVCSCGMQTARAIHTAITRLRQRKASLYTVSTTQKSLKSVQTTTIVTYGEDQFKEYVKRQRLRILDVEQAEARFKDGMFVRRC